MAANDWADRDHSNPVTRRSFLIGLAGLVCLKLLKEEALAAETLQPFSFAVVSDIHLTTDRPDTFMLFRESQLFLQDVVKQLNNEKLDFIIFNGDQIELLGKNQANWQLFLDIAQALNCPWSFTLGERDIADELPVDKMRTYGPEWRSRGIETDHPWWSQNPLPGVHIIGLDTSRPNSPTGDLGSRQLNWLKNDLEANKDKFTIVFSHHPLLTPPPYDSGPPWDEYTLPSGPAVREVIGNYANVHLAVSGHVWASKVEREKDIWYVSCPGVAVYPCAYRIFHVGPDSISIETKPVKFPALVKKAKKALCASSFAFSYDRNNPQNFAALIAGERIDNDALLPLTPGKEAHAQAKSKSKKEKSNKKAQTKPPTPAKK